MMGTILWPHTVPYFSILDLPQHLLQHSHTSTLGNDCSGGSAEVRTVAGLAGESRALLRMEAQCVIGFPYTEQTLGFLLL